MANLGFGRAMTGLVQMAAVNRLEGHRDEAMGWLRAALQFAEDYRNDETRPDYLVSRLDGELIEEAGACLRAFGDDPECIALVRKIQVSTLAEPVELVSSVYRDYATADAELAQGLISWDSPCTPAGADGKLALRLYNMGSTRKSVRLRLLTCLRRHAESLQDVNKTYDQLAAEQERIWNEFTKGPPTDAVAFAAEHLFPQFSMTYTHAGYYCHLQAKSRLLDAGLFVAEQAGNGIPLAKLPNETRFCDPFSAQSLVYRRLPSGYRIYSVGHNGKDDGGDESEESDDIELGICYSTDDL
ncbi:MAG: hypothetical protein K1X67_21270 [Fimbriimonadaceae bacterium]|nr:hypothetical protein [Fimbriimonadaceae bacterium]